MSVVVFCAKPDSAEIRILLADFPAIPHCSDRELWLFEFLGDGVAVLVVGFG